jgi:hypothetical protein
MDVKLKVLEGKNAGQEIKVPGKKFLIGRAEDCHLRPGSELISRHHCVLLIEEGYLAVRDFGSKNGTFVNDERVVGERELKAGDRLTIGPLRFAVHMAHGLASKKLPPVSDVKEAAARTAQNAAHDPMDVTQWLSGGDDDVAAKPKAQPSLTDTEAIPMSTTQTLTPGAIPPATEEPKPHHPPGKRTPGKLPTVPTGSKDSQEAANAILNKMRKRR